MCHVSDVLLSSDKQEKTFPWICLQSHHCVYNIHNNYPTTITSCSRRNHGQEHHHPDLLQPLLVGVIIMLPAMDVINKLYNTVSHTVNQISYALPGNAVTKEYDVFEQIASAGPGN